MLTTSSDAAGAHLRLLGARVVSSVVCTGVPLSAVTNDHGCEFPADGDQRAASNSKSVAEEPRVWVGSQARGLHRSWYGCSTSRSFRSFGSSPDGGEPSGEAAAGIDGSKGLTVGLRADSHLATEMRSQRD